MENPVELEVTLKWVVGALVTLTIPIGIKAFFKTKIGKVITQNVPITTEAGSSPNIALAGRDAFAAQEMHIHQGDNISGKRREALRILKNANEGIIWAIGQSKDPRNRNRPDQYTAKLQDAFEANFSYFTKTDLELLEPIVDIISDSRKTFSELETPCVELNKVIDSLK